MRPRIFGSANWFIQDSLIIKIILIAIPRKNLNGYQKIISLTTASKKNINVFGPTSGDSMLTKENINKFDIFVFIFHDQALIPFKYISQFSGVNYTGNLDIIRVSPDHGTAYNLVGKNKGSDKSLINCIKTVNKIYKNRIKNWLNQKNLFLKIF